MDVRTERLVDPSTGRPAHIEVARVPTGAGIAHLRVVEGVWEDTLDELTEGERDRITSDLNALR